MSTIAVVRKGGEICMASDSLTSFGTTQMDETFKINDSKIFQWGNSVIGTVGDVAMKMIFLDLVDSKPEPDLSSRNAIFKYFTQLHNELKENYFVNPKEDEDDPVESSQFEIVIANPHGLFGVHSLREVYNLNKFWAYGSGRRFALGAMHALYELEGFDAEKIAMAGAKAGITFDESSGGAIVLKRVKLL